MPEQIDIGILETLLKVHIGDFRFQQFMKLGPDVRADIFDFIIVMMDGAFEDGSEDGFAFGYDEGVRDGYYEGYEVAEDEFKNI